MTDEQSLAAGQPPESWRDRGTPLWARLPWRTGRKVGKTVYVQFGPMPHDDDELIGVMFTAELAEAAVRGHNREVVEPQGKQGDWEQAEGALRGVGEDELPEETIRRLRARAFARDPEWSRGYLGGVLPRRWEEEAGRAAGRGWAGL